MRITRCLSSNRAARGLGGQIVDFFAGRGMYCRLRNQVPYLFQVVLHNCPVALLLYYIFYLCVIRQLFHVKPTFASNFTP